jgi:hypothetical protein
MNFYKSALHLSDHGTFPSSFARSSFKSRAPNKQPAAQTGTLSRRELRQIVAELLG